MMFAVSDPSRGPTDREIELAMDSARERMTLSFVHGVGALLAVIVVIVTTRRHLRRLRAEPEVR